MRVIHLTFYKCASQWVRDILTDTEVAAASGFPLSIGGVDVNSEGWPDAPSGSVAGPLYGASYENWLANSTEKDRAIVVLRDPRDLVISLVFSLGFSHVPSSMTRLLRSPISSASDGDRVRIGIFLLTQWADRMRSWGTATPGDREYITSYRRLTGHPREEFAAIFRFLGWKVEPRLLDRVLERHSFEKRTGRRPGDINPFSHLRKGVDEDWRNYFDRELGEDFEATFPRLLTDLGYESNSDWYLALPEKLAAGANRIPSGEDRVQELLNRLAAQEDQYTELGLWRTAAEERLEQIRALTANVDALQERVAAPNLETRQHLSQINELTSTVRHLENQLADRLAANQRLNIVIQEMGARIDERNAVAGQRLEQIFQLTRMVDELESRLAAPNVVAEERLAQIHILTNNVLQLQDRIAQPDPVAEERLADILKLTAHIESIERTLAEVDSAAQERKRIIDDIRASASYRYGFLPLSKLGSVLR